MDSQYDKGLVTRKQVMGDDYVAAALANATDFTRPAWVPPWPGAGSSSPG